MSNDTIYFSGPHAPDGKDWVHCTVERTAADGVTYSVQARGSYNATRYFAPMHTVQRVQYGDHRR